MLDLTPKQAAILAQDHGAGEILLTSIDHDGEKLGYDFSTINDVLSSVSIPVIACGGIGNAGHLKEAIIKHNYNVIAVGNYFNFIEHAVVMTKSYLLQEECNVRLDTQFSYQEHSFDSQQRIVSMSPEQLMSLRFKSIPIDDI